MVWEPLESLDLHGHSAAATRGEEVRECVLRNNGEFAYRAAIGKGASQEPSASSIGTSATRSRMLSRDAMC
jgi:hypothetical protein